MSGTPFSILSYRTLVHAVAGAAGSIAAMSLFYPLETARTRLQIDDKREARYTPRVIAQIVREEGVDSLYRGWFPVISSLCCSNFVYFYTFNGLKAACSDHMKATVAIKELLIGIIAGVINVLITTPMWVVNMRMKLQGANFLTEHKQKSKHPHYNGIFHAFKTIISDEGLGALWSGTSSSLLLVLNPAIHFMVYEAFKRYLTKYTGDKEHSSFLYFMMGAVAKIVATLTTYPLQLVQTKQRYGKEESESHKKLKSMWSVLTYIVRNQGLLGLFKGLEAKLLQTVLTAAMMFTIYEKIAAVIFQLMKAEKPHIKGR